MLPAEDLRNAASDTNDATGAANAAYLAAKHASGQLSKEDYALLQKVQISREAYLEQFWYQSRHTILRAYLHDYLTVREVMRLLRVG